MTTQTSFVLLLASIAGFAAIAPTAAGPTPRECRRTDAIPPVTITVSMGDRSIAFDAGESAAGVANGDGTFSFDGGRAALEQWTLDYALVVDPDPFVFTTMVLTNITASPQQFTITVGLPATPLAASTINAYARGRLYDRNGDGIATCSFLGAGEGALCLIDNTVIGSMTMLAGTSVTTAAPSAPIGPIAKPVMPGPAVNSSVGMTLTFTLSAGDAVELKGAFIVN